ncbi:MAG: c-type cytochrome [Deltaproteobacteria bacterium]|nr:c-type cytochrome [Deltaproteobacteria bacterium]
MKSYVLTLTILVAVFIGVILSTEPLLSEDNTYALWGDPQKGRQVFAQKGCIKCHAIRGVGGKVGSDLGKSPSYHLTVTQLAGVMWNHAPAMRELAVKSAFIWKPFEGSEMRDLFAYIYSLHYLDEPGDVKKGEKLFSTKGCENCHSVGTEAHKIGGDLSKWRGLVSPILWAEVMWGHAAEMEERMKEMGVEWPEFKGNELVDLITYIRSKSREIPER